MSSLRPDRLSPRVLLIEDNPGDARLFEAVLGDGELEAELRWETSLGDGLRSARDHEPDVMVVDLNLPDCEGLETVRRAVEAAPGTPVVVLTGLEELETATEALKHGASEYLRKDGLTPLLLARTLRMALVRHRLEREAERERALSRAILQSLPEHVAVVDGEGNIRAVNRPWQQFARSEGGDPDAYEGENYLAVTEASADAGEPGAREMLEGLREVLAGERDRFALEYPCHGPDERRWFQVQVTPLRGADSEGAVVSHINITERVERERYLSTLADNLPGVLYRCENRPGWPMAYLSPGVRDLTGYTAEELIGPGPVAYGDLIHPDDRERVWAEVQEAIADGRPFQLEYRMKSRSEGEKWIWEQGQAVPSAGREAELLEGYLVDDTGRIRTRRELEQSEERWSSAFEMVPAGLAISDAVTGHMHALNRALAEMFGYPKSQILGRTSLELHMWEDEERRSEIVVRLEDRKSVRNEEAWFRTADGERRRLRIAVRRLELAGEDRLLWAAEDITEQVERERALAERVKEQSCLYDVSRILHEDERALEVRLQTVVDRIPAGWQYPEVTVAKLEVKGHPPYLSEGFEEVEERLETDLAVEGERVGELVVGYREERPEEDLGPFLREERELLEELAERIEIELSRQKTRREMGHLVETMTEAVFIVAPDGTITFANSAACRLHGVRDGELTGQDLTDFAPQVKTLAGEPSRPEELPFQRVRRTGRPVTGHEELIEREDGERIVISVNAAPMMGEDGELRGVVLTVRDVTDRHRADEWRHLLESSVEAASQGILITDREGMIVWVNPAFTEMTGYRREEAIGEIPRTLLQSGAHDDAFYDDIWSTIRAGEVWEGEIVNRRKDGTLFVEQMSFMPVRHRGDEITHFIAIKEDVTEQKQSEEALRRSEVRYRTLVETMAEATVIHDPEGRMTFANEEAEKLLGLEASDIQGRSYADPVWRITTAAGEPFPEQKLPFRRVVATGRPIRDVEFAIERPDGSRRILSVNAAPLSGDEEGLEGVVATFRDVTERHRMEAELRHRSLHDSLTGLPNRALFWDRLEHALERSRRGGEVLAVLFLDVDGFKRINDEHGHAAGDEALRQVADRLRAGVRDADTLARLGGDEFGVLLEDLEDASEADKVVRRLTERFASPIAVAGEEALVRMSCGVALAGGGRASEPVTADGLVHRADRAMYAAKAAPGSTYRRFGPEIAEEHTGRLRREIELNEALENGDVVPHYQPLVDLSDGRIVGAEALARWEHPERGLVAPGVFIPLAEETGLIVELGRQVIRAACGQLVAWRDEGHLPSDFYLHVNLSARELDRPDVVDVLDEMFRELGLDPEGVAFEVTETVAIESAHILERIRALGSPVAIDDFGTGYATLERLAFLELDNLKIDRLFVDQIGASARHEAVLEASLTLAAAMGLSPVAEGVETEEQRAWLLEHGCQLAQGFLFSRAVPAEEFAGWLRAGRRLPV